MASTTGSATAGVGGAEVAKKFYDEVFQDVVEEEIAISLGQGGVAGSRVLPWSSLTSFDAAYQTALGLGYGSGNTAWEQCGINVDGEVPTAADVERRRDVLRSVFSAGQAHGWPEGELARGRTFLNDIEKALDRCHAELPDLARKLRKKKAGKSLVPTWQEPSALIFEFGLGLRSNSVIALHLSNLQNQPIGQLCVASAIDVGPPQVLAIPAARELYTRLSQAQAKIEEALIAFKDNCILMWAPDNRDQIPRILSALQKLYTDKGAFIQIQFLVPFAPLPGCHSPELILDLWSHPLLQPKYSNHVSEICFIREASRCVFTRGNTPIHTIKNIVAVTVQASTTATVSRELAMRSLLLGEASKGEDILIDVPAKNAYEIWHQLNARPLSAETDLRIERKLHKRSRANTATDPRSTLVGHTSKAALVEVRGLIRQIRKDFGQEGIIIGHASMFGDNTTVIVEGTLPQISAMTPMM